MAAGTGTGWMPAGQGRHPAPTLNRTRVRDTAARRHARLNVTVHYLCNGHPTVRGLRITVETVLGFLSAGDSPSEILEQYPSLEPADIDACIRFTADFMGRRYTLQRVA